MRYFNALMVLTILMSFGYASNGYANDDDKYLDIQSVTSDSGITAWLVEDHSIPLLAMRFVFTDAGAKNDTKDKQGLTRLASNTMDEGAGDILSQEFQKTLQDLSISLSFSAGRDNFNGNLKTLTQHQDKAFELLKLAVNKPRFDQEPLDRMRASNKSRVKASLADPRWLNARIQNDILFEGHPYALNSGGTLTTLDSITPDDLREFHKRLGRNNLVIAVTGAITADDLKQTLDNVFGALPVVEKHEKKTFKIKNTGKTYLHEKDIPQTVIEIAQNGISRNDEDYYAAKLMNFILGESGFGSRLMEEIREERGLTYGIYSYFRDFDETDVMHVSTSTVNESVSEMLGLIDAEWEKMKSQPVSEQELKDAKSYIIGSLPLSLTSTGSIASILLSMQLDNLPIDYLDTRAEKFNTISAQDIQKVANRLLDTDSFTTVLVGKPVGIDNVINIKDIPNVE